MIAKIEYCKSPAKAIAYDAKLGQDKAHSVFLGSSFGETDPKEIIYRLNELANQNNKLNVNYKFLHISISFSPHEQIDQMKMLAVSRIYLDKMYGTGLHYACHFHDDKPHPHMHLILSRVNETGKILNSKYDWYRSKEICRELELTFNLRPTKNEANEKRKIGSVGSC